MRLLIVCFLLILLLSGCSSYTSDKVTTPKKSDQPKANVEAKTVVSNKPVKVKKLQISNPKNASTPSEAIKTGSKWVLSNGKEIVPKDNDLLSVSTLGRQSIVVAKIPQVSQYWMNIFYLNQDKKNQWGVLGIIDRPIDPNEKQNDKEGLDIPFKTFEPATLSLPLPKNNKIKLPLDKDNKIWSFTTEGHYLIVTTLTKDSISSNESLEMLQLKNNREAFLSKNGDNLSLYYIEQNRVIWVIGDVSKDKFIAFVDSIPPIFNSFFPFNK